MYSMCKSVRERCRMSALKDTLGESFDRIVVEVVVWTAICCHFGRMED